MVKSVQVIFRCKEAKFPLLPGAGKADYTVVYMTPLDGPTRQIILLPEAVDVGGNGDLYLERDAKGDAGQH